MSTGLIVFECSVCGKVVFPRRLLCPDCGSSKWVQKRVDRGKLRESTTVRRFGGHEAEVRVGSVEIGPELIVIARVPADTDAGSGVKLSMDAGVPVVEELP